MRNINYNFLTEGTFEVEPEVVWRVISNPESMPLWWPGVKKADVKGADKELKKGMEIDCAVKGLLGDLAFTMTVAEIEPFKMLRFESRGDLEGEGLCLIKKSQNGQTEVTFKWGVRTTGLAMNLFGTVLKPLFCANHNRVMRKGYEALKTRFEKEKAAVS